MIEKKHAKIIYVQDAFIVHKGHIRCTVAQKSTFLILIFNRVTHACMCRY